ncbi:alpha/beta hydrolase family protein [Flavobacterium sp. '19STA2R22 D10 B1']|uniref:alpha/beta hydrolase family protein n=1 Tax=Flavobacterium aerium TaxID=3037261 RepID=UPI00278BE997|nr:prolyl oligopeptidase family serine peptidase [Flavobacterium sp. '19STA2R22 D10 B1']
METVYYKVLVMVLLFLSCSAQQQKRKITIADYAKWGTLSGESISPDGNWVSFQMTYENSLDTMFIRRINSKVTYNFPKADDIVFSKDSFSAAISGPENNLEILNLKSGERQAYNNMLKHNFSNDGKYLLVLQQDSIGNTLSILDSNNFVISKTKGVSDYSISTSNKIAIETNQGLKIASLGRIIEFREIVHSDLIKYKKLTWDKSGNFLAFYISENVSTKINSLAYLNTDNMKLQKLDAQNLQFDNVIFQFKDSKLVVASDAQKIYFSCVEIKHSDSVKPIVEVWETSSPLEYPAQENLKVTNGLFLASWTLGGNSVEKLEPDTATESKILPGDKLYLSYSKLTYEPQYAELAPVDYYLNNFENTGSKLIITKGSISANAVLPSPDGNFISHFKGGNYFVYDTSKEISVNVTASLHSDFYREGYDNAAENEGYTSPGFTNDSRFLIVYDKYDIWLVSTDDYKGTRITNGRETKQCFRIPTEIYLKQVGNFAEFSKYEFDINQGIVCSAFGEDKSSGYYMYTKEKGLRKLDYGKSQKDRIKKAKSKHTYCYIEQTEQSPPSLVVYNVKTGKRKKVYQSNAHYNKYEWSRSELITYKNTAGETLQGILMYPSDYESGKKYPMVTYIYEKLSQHLYEYINPTLLDRAGFKASTYFLDGYFVLLPDIQFALGDPGKSAVDCITAAVNTVVARGLVNKDKLGIIGHSFGGYEVSLIITQTELFSAAVAGSGVTDIISWYHTMNYIGQHSNAWRLESQQFRMGSSPFDNKLGYENNSPIMNAAKIKTPLLSWAGTADTQVNFEQSVELHLAMRRLGKTGTMLLYPGQGHILTDESTQQDLTARIKTWFDKYLKGF